MLQTASTMVLWYSHVLRFVVVVFFFLQMFPNCSYPHSVSFNPAHFHYSLHGRVPALPQLPSVNVFLSSPSICPSNDSSKPRSLGDKCSLQIKPGEEYNLITKNEDYDYWMSSLGSAVFGAKIPFQMIEIFSD